MRATGEVMGAADSFELAFYKAQEAAGAKLPTKGNILLTVADKDKEAILPLAEKIQSLGFSIYATEGTSRFLKENKIENTKINKLHEGRPNIADAIKNDELQLIINTPIGKDSKHDDSYIRMMSIQKKTPYVTSIAAAEASIAGIEAVKNGGTIFPKALQEYHN
ncbi:MAG: carbamoyl phosphate synthase large subunit, partial [Candidatus Omnitrophica bacterium]|nr:carbamoyl phosphate synthase large subunit [Candidatus Omnitrophota bacterium]